MTTVADVDMTGWVRQSASPIRDGSFPSSLREGMPIGIPEPWADWNESLPDRPSTWTSESAGYYFVNQGTGTDTARTYGDPTAPRATIPNPVPAGSYIEVEGNYTLSTGGVIRINSSGTSGDWVANTSGAVWVTGSQEVAATHSFNTLKIVAYGTYLYLDGLTVDTGSLIQVGSVANGFGVDYITVRNCDITGQPPDASQSLVAVQGEISTVATNVVIYNNVAHDTGDVASLTDDDAGCYTTNGYTSNVWFLSNIGHTSSGTGLQINPSTAINAACFNIYAGNNEFYNTRQSGMWVKYATNVVFSQNYCHDIINTTWSPSKCMGAQYQPNGLWMLYNRLEGARYGAHLASTSGAGGYQVYIIGNVMQDIGNTTDIDGTSAFEDSAIFVNGDSDRFIYNNVIYNMTHGLNIATASGDNEIYNNIFMDVKDATGKHIWVEFGMATTTIESNLFYQTAGTEVLGWDGTDEYTLATFKSTISKCTTNCNVSDPVFSNTSIGNFLPTVTTNTLDAGASLSALDTIYFGIFGEHMNALDYVETARVQGGTIDIGAYEVG